MKNIFSHKKQISNDEITNIGFITGTLGIGGAERQLFLLISSLNRAKYQPFVINLDPESGNYWEQRIRDCDVHIINICRGNKVKRLYKIRRAIHKNNINIVQGLNFYANGYAVLAKWPDKNTVIGGLRNLPVKAHINKVPGWWRWLCFNKVNYLICNSHNANSMLQNLYPSLTGIKTIPNAVSIISAEECKKLRQKAKVELGINNTDLVVGFVGNLSKQKNIPLLLNAASGIVKDFPHLKIIIVGDGIMRTELESLALKLKIEDHISFVGQKSNAINLMPAFDLLCLPSDYEGMPNVLMEAAAVGIPVIASDVAGIPEVVQDGKTGLLFPAGDFKSLENAIRSTLLDPNLRSIMGHNARIHMTELFSIDRMVNAYENLYAEILNKQSEKSP